MIEILEEKSFILYTTGKENRKRPCVKIKCSNCKKEFWKEKRSINKLKSDEIFCSRKCKKEFTHIELNCSYCGDSFLKRKSSLTCSKSGLYFCCRNHKDLAQRIENNNPKIWGNHYGNAKATYRDKAIRNYGAMCSHCGYDDLDICVVHHIDMNRNNNDLDNLLVVCPNCHEAIHKGFYIVKNRKLISTEIED